jgi:hypothetical protein
VQAIMMDVPRVHLSDKRYDEYFNEIDFDVSQGRGSTSEVRDKLKEHWYPDEIKEKFTNSESQPR